MRIKTTPVTSFEVRWFFEGSLGQQDALCRWFYGVRPSRGPLGSTRQTSYPGSTERTDVHLVLPGAADLAIRWRLGSLQVKGRMESGRAETFCGRFDGRLEPWVTWSYEDLSAFYRNVFVTPPRGVVTVPVRQSRLVRAIRLDARTNLAEEARPGTRLDRGMTVELADLDVNGIPFCSLRFKAFPGDARIPASLVREASGWLESLEHVTLSAANCWSLPEWLGVVAGCSARPVPVAPRRFGLAVAL
jgi:hypothetical protein